jgi:hypothetical protein
LGSTDGLDDPDADVGEERDRLVDDRRGRGGGASDGSAVGDRCQYNLEVLFDRFNATPGRRPENAGPEAGQPATDRVRNQLAKILSSQPFVNSPQLCRFLSFVTDREISGQGDQLKEYSVGIGVFRKDESFDPRIDTVVRTEARRLRLKLTEYYQNEGLADPIEIDLPKGGYRPGFRFRSPVSPLRVAEAPPVQRVSPKLFALAGVLLLAAGLFGWWFMRAKPQEAGHSGPQSIAVLPLDNLSADPQQEYFSDGMTDALITSLADIQGLRVISRTSVLQYKRAGRPIAENRETARRGLRCGRNRPTRGRTRAHHSAADRGPQRAPFVG